MIKKATSLMVEDNPVTMLNLDDVKGIQEEDKLGSDSFSQCTSHRGSMEMHPSSLLSPQVANVPHRESAGRVSKASG